MEKGEYADVVRSAVQVYSDCVSLTTLTCGSLGLTSFDFIVGGGESLQVINSTFNSLSSLDMKRFPNLTNLDIQYNDGDIVSVDFSANQKLNSLAISNSSMPVDLDLSSCPVVFHAGVFHHYRQDGLKHVLLQLGLP